MGAGTDVDVLVVGAGPTGLTLAAELLRRGLSVRLVDKEASASTSSRAIVVHARTLELLDDLGVAAALVERGHKVVGATVWAGGEQVVRMSFEELTGRHPYLLSVGQTETEAVLRGLVEGRGGRIEWGTELVSFRQDGTGVDAVLRAAGGEERIRAAWLVGADGAHSTVRKQLEVPFAEPAHEERTLLADVRIDWDARDDRVSAWVGDEGLLACFPMRGGRWRLVFSAPAGDTRSEPPTLPELSALFAERTGSDAKLSDDSWRARFRIHARQVARYRDDRVLLAGDAAHIHSPASGQGMNAGIQDAHNLGWKLALVHQGHGRGLLLDTYESERRGVGRGLLAGSEHALKLGLVQGNVPRAARPVLARFLSGFELVQERLPRESADASLTYAASPIVHEDTTSLLHARIGTAAGGETPTLASVREFERGPAVGSRAVDGRVTVAGEPGTRRLGAALDTDKTTVLLFDGESASAEGYARFTSVAKRLRERFGAAVDVRVVTPRAERPAQLPDELVVLLDPDRELERRYAASTECVYAIRPDLWIGYRAQPCDEEKLVDWLRSFLR